MVVIHGSVTMLSLFLLSLSLSVSLAPQSEPCLNGGRCEVTWNHFLCSCPKNFSGRLCETRLWCVEEPCLAGARCMDLADGYECNFILPLLYIILNICYMPTLGL